jgi:hypothetical protein
MPKILFGVGFVRFYRSVKTISKERSAPLLREVLLPSLIPLEAALHVGEQPRLSQAFLSNTSAFPLPRPRVPRRPLSLNEGEGSRSLDHRFVCKFML